MSSCETSNVIVSDKVVARYERASKASASSGDPFEMEEMLEGYEFTATLLPLPG